MHNLKENARARFSRAAITIAMGSAALSAYAQDPANEVSAREAYEEHAIDEIIVEGAALDRTVEQLAQPTAIVGGDALTKKQSASLGETVSQELGVSSSYFGPVSSRPIIRGQFGERVRVLSNSLDSLDASALSEDHAVSVDSILAERIEIVRGPATLLYGSGAAGGLVNVIDNRILERPLTAPLNGAVALGGDSATGAESAAAKITFGNERIAAHLDYFRRDTDDVDIPGFAESALLRAMELEEIEENGGVEPEEAFGVVENTDSTSDGGAAAITLTGESGYIGFSYGLHNSNYGVPGHGHEEGEEEEGAEEEEEIVRIDLEQKRFDIKGEYSFENESQVRFRFADNDYQHIEFEGAEVGTIFDTDGFDGRLEWRHGQIGPIEGAFGVQVKHIDFNAIGDEAFVPQSTTKQTSLFAFEEWALNDRWVLQGSVRAERQTISTQTLLAPYSDNAYGASLGVIWSIDDDHSLALNYALTERHPNSTELYADGAHIAVDRIERGSVVLGDGVLDQELSSNVDLALRGDNDRVEWELALFVNDIDDYILLSPTAAIEEDFQVFEYRQTEARLSGFEAEARVELFEVSGGHLHTRLFADYVRGENRRAGTDLPRIPPLRYGAELHLTMDRFDAGIEARFHSEQDRFAPNELPTDSYVLVNAELSYVWAEPNVYVFMRAKNLTDEDARQHTSPLKDTFPLPGRSIQVGLRYDF